MANAEHKHWAEWQDDPMKYGFSRFGKFQQKVIYDDIAPALQFNPDADNAVLETTCKSALIRSGELFADLPGGGFRVGLHEGVYHEEVEERMVCIASVLGSSRDVARVVLEYLVGIQTLPLYALWENVTRAFMRPIYQNLREEPKPAIADSLYYSRVAEFKLAVEGACLIVTVVLSTR